MTAKQQAFFGQENLRVLIHEVQSTNRFGERRISYLRDVLRAAFQRLVTRVPNS